MIPLLFEANFTKICSEIWVVNCTKKQQLIRLMERDGVSKASAYKKIKQSTKKIAKKTGTTFQFKQTINIVPEPTNGTIRNAIFEASNDLKLKSKFMPSGAGHDAQEMAQICPIGMIFIPSKDGISHSPKESSSPNDISNGANVLLHTVLKIDEGSNQ